MTLLARVRSSLMEDRHRANTASPMRVTEENVGYFELHCCMVLTRHSGVKSGDSGPFSGTFLLSFVQDLGQDRFTVIVIKFEDLGGDLDQERVKDTLIPRQEDVGDFRLVET